MEFYEYPITSTFTDHVASGRPGGVDYATPIGVPIRSQLQGQAVYKIDQYGGLFIDVAGGNRMDRYLHLDPKDFVQGSVKQVNKGDVIGYSGNTGWSTGPHTHYEVWINGQRVDPLLYINTNHMNIITSLTDGAYNTMHKQRTDLKKAGITDKGKMINWLNTNGQKEWFDAIAKLGWFDIREAADNDPAFNVAEWVHLFGVERMQDRFKTSMIYDNVDKYRIDKRLRECEAVKPSDCSQQEKDLKSINNISKKYA